MSNASPVIQKTNQKYQIQHCRNSSKIPNTTLSEQFQNTNEKMSEKETKTLDSSNTYIQDRSLSWLGTDIQIKSGGVKLVLLVETSPLGEMMKRYKICIVLFPSMNHCTKHFFFF
jgi:hypothetical protein